MQSIGESLKSAREAKGISLEQAEENTKIRKRYLQALEEGDYEVIPGLVYAKGFLRNYANYLGLNQEEIMIEYKLLGMPQKVNTQKVDIEASINKRRAGNRLNRKINMITVIVAVLAILTFAVYIAVSAKAGNKGVDRDNKQIQTENADNKSSGNKAPAVDNKTGSTPDNFGISGLPGDTNQPSQTGSESSVDGGNKASSEKIVVQGLVNVTLKGKDEPCWVRATVDGKVVFANTINPGETKTFNSANKVKLRFGNAGGIDVVLNGQDLGTMGGIGEIVNREYSSDTSGIAQNQ